MDGTLVGDGSHNSQKNHPTKNPTKVLEKHPFLSFLPSVSFILWRLAVVQCMLLWKVGLVAAFFRGFLFWCFSSLFFLFFFGLGVKVGGLISVYTRYQEVLSQSAALASCLIDESSENPSSHQCRDISGCSSSSGIVYLLELPLKFGDQGARTASFDIIGHQSLMSRGRERPVST